VDFWFAKLIFLCPPGKVKSQTPKVEKQEKAKVPKGRAHKRDLYTRRFVNVTIAPGGKRKVRIVFGGLWEGVERDGVG
jgi:small subunit ribosomal protein S30e